MSCDSSTRSAFVMNSESALAVIAHRRRPAVQHTIDITPEQQEAIPLLWYPTTWIVEAIVHVLPSLGTCQLGVRRRNARGAPAFVAQPALALLESRHRTRDNTRMMKDGMAVREYLNLQSSRTETGVQSRSVSRNAGLRPVGRVRRQREPHGVPHGAVIQATCALVCQPLCRTGVRSRRP